MRKLFYSFITIIIACSFVACADDDNFSSDPNLRLTFSSDTIRFDTIFSTIGSTTKQLKIYNRNSNSLTIQSIELVNASSSGFRININGERGTLFSNVDILKKDSMFAFIEVTANISNQRNPLVIRDSIRFITNGNIQYVQLEAVGQDVHIWKGKVISQDTILTDDKPFLITDSLVIQKGVTVNINEGVRFFFRRNASLQIYGTVKASGSVEDPIILRADRFGNIEGNIPYDNVSGQWTGIIFHPESFNNQLENVFIRNAVKGITFSESTPQYKKATLKNTIVHNTSEYGVLAINCNIDAQNCLFTNSRGATLTVFGGEYSFLHCTFANYYRWSVRQMQTLVIGNLSSTTKDLPLIKCDIINSIIYGSLSKEILLKGSPNSSFNYQFINCVIRGEANNDSHFVNTLWNADPLFVDINNSTQSFNFELKSESPAINKADKQYSLPAPFDLNGNSRLSDSNPDIGCYEWIAQ